MNRSWRRILARLVLGGLTFVAVVGPWPALDTPTTVLRPIRDTATRLDQIFVPAERGPVRVGVAEIDLLPVAAVPVAGFFDQIWQPYVGVNSRCQARALTVAGRSDAVTILTADLLLIDARLTREILARTGLQRSELYLTASHTHSGPGGWGNHPLERLVAGTYDPEATADLADRLAEVIRASRVQLQPVEVAFVQTEVPGVQENRILTGGPTNDLLSAWVFRPIAAATATAPSPTPMPLATLVTFGAHATVAHPKPARLGGDYPTALAEALRATGQAGVVLFAAGSVGDAAPVRPPAANQQLSAQAYGAHLARTLAEMLPRAKFLREIELANLALVVDLPPVQVAFGSDQLRFSPLAFWWVAQPRTILHTLRLGPAVLAGFPGDLSGALARQLHGSVPIVATSFNGDYKGYLIPEAIFRSHATRSRYETRWMSFFGAGLGDLLVQLSQRSIDRVLDAPP